MSNQLSNRLSPTVRHGLLAGATIGLCWLPTLAQAHTGIDQHSGFGAGLQHPIGGLDHLLTMVAVGLWAAQLGGNARWALPIGFVSAMGLGGWLGMMALPLPNVEAGILLSSLLLGGLILRAVRWPAIASLGLVSSLALCHGIAHGQEMPTSSDSWDYAAGFLLATAGLHLIGYAAAWALQQTSHDRAIQWMGGLVLLCGLLGLVSAISG
jgi:urease accessory protein